VFHRWLYPICSNTWSYCCWPCIGLWRGNRRTFIRTVGVHTGLLGSTVERIATEGEIVTRHWMGQLGTGVVVKVEECTKNVDLKWLLPARLDWQGVLEIRPWLHGGKPFWIWTVILSSIPVHLDYELRTNVSRWKQLIYTDGTYRWWRTYPYPSNRWRFCGGFQQSQGGDTPAALVNWPCNWLGAWLQVAPEADCNWAQLSWAEGSGIPAIEWNMNTCALSQIMNEYSKILAHMDGSMSCDFLLMDDMFLDES